MSKRKVKETQEIQQYQVGDTIHIKGLDYRVVEVMVDGYHVKNINPPFNSFIYVQGAGSIQGNSYAEAITDELPQFQTPEELEERLNKVISQYQDGFDASKFKAITEFDKNAPDLLYRPDDRISL